MKTTRHTATTKKNELVKVPRKHSPHVLHAHPDNAEHGHGRCKSKVLHRLEIVEIHVPTFLYQIQHVVQHTESYHAPVKLFCIGRVCVV